MTAQQGISKWLIALFFAQSLIQLMLALKDMLWYWSSSDDLDATRLVQFSYIAAFFGVASLVVSVLLACSSAPASTYTPFIALVFYDAVVVVVSIYQLVKVFEHEQRWAALSTIASTLLTAVLVLVIMVQLILHILRIMQKQQRRNTPYHHLSA